MREINKPMNSISVGDFKINYMNLADIEQEREVILLQLIYKF